MIVAAYQGKENIVLEKCPVPRLLHLQDVIIKVTLTITCSSDIRTEHGAMPKAVPDTILGYELVGIVEEIETGVKGVKPGDRVAVNVETFCEERYFCKRGYVSNCTDEHGGWALGCRIDDRQSGYVRIPFADNGLTKVPDLVTDETALLIGNLFSTGYWSAALAEIKPTDITTILEVGPTGLCTLMYARLYNPARVTVVDVSDERLELAKARGFADVTLNPLNRSIEQGTPRLTDGRGADAVLKTAGSRDTLQTAWKVARPNAAMCMVAMYGEAQTLLLPDMYGKNLVFKTGSMDASRYEQIVEPVRVGRLDTGYLVIHRTTLDHIMETYDVFGSKRDHMIKYTIKAEQRGI